MTYLVPTAPGVYKHMFMYHDVEDKADCKSLWLWELQHKASQVISQLSPSIPHENNMIANAMTDFAFALIKTIPIIITIACWSSNKNNIHLDSQITPSTEDFQASTN